MNNDKNTFVPVAVIHTALTGKTGIPRQGGTKRGLCGVISFNKPFRNTDAVRGLEEFSHIWLIWRFSNSLTAPEDFSPLVYPPKMRHPRAMGIFATRTPLRPNSIGISAVRLEFIDTESEGGPFLHVSGIDLMDGTPILDIKPYIPFSDCFPDATRGFTSDIDESPLTVSNPGCLASIFNKSSYEEVLRILSHDPRRGNARDSQEVFTIIYRGVNIRFTIRDKTVTILH